MHRELEGDSARFANTLADALRQEEVVAVAGRKVAPGLRDADDRLATTQFGKRQAEVEIALQVERRHIDVGRVIEPGAAAKRPATAGVVAHRAKPSVAMFAVSDLPGASAPTIVVPLADAPIDAADAVQYSDKKAQRKRWSGQSEN